MNLLVWFGLVWRSTSVLQVTTEVAMLVVPPELLLRLSNSVLK
jgi:hypothetical protein